MELLETIREYWSMVSLAITTLAIPGVGYAYRKYKEAEKRQQSIEHGMRALLKERIVQAYSHFVGEGAVTIQGLDAVENIYHEYLSLGGSGAVTKLVEDLRELEVRDERIDAATKKRVK